MKHLPQLYFLPILLCSIFLLACSGKEKVIDSYIGFDIPLQELDTYLDEKMEELDIPGMSIAFINDGQVVHHRTMGYAFLENQTPVTDKTIFEAASLSKSVFAHFAMTYVDEGRLDLDKPLYEYLPYPDIAHDERYKKITARMVLSHRSGFPNWRTDFEDEELFIEFEPGTDFLYSGEGYMYLSMVLKEIEQTDWEGLEAIFQKKVAHPMGLEHTVFIQDAYSKANKAEPYDENGDWISWENNPDSIFQYEFRAPASVHSEALDFSKWMLAIMRREGLSEEAYREMFKIHSPIKMPDAPPLAYTLGFYTLDVPLMNLYAHGGNNYGFTAFFALDPDKDWGYVLFTNSEYGEDLGGELLFYLLTGPDMSKVYVSLGAILLILLGGILVLLRFVWRRWKQGRGKK
ncbi:MAG: serine hydrolase domain-containing protein [Bacteroidota bacterium]